MGNQALQGDKGDLVGGQVTQVLPLSPAFDAGLVVKDDFVLEVDGQCLAMMSMEKVMQMVEANQEKPLRLLVLHLPTQSQRHTNITPSAHWPGQGLLGIKLML
ncbi:hypothetical protein B484DRAFT_405224, partial [Ochromonadaceae sp. CCMP2298]